MFFKNYLYRLLFPFRLMPCLIIVSISLNAGFHEEFDDDICLGLQQFGKLHGVDLDEVSKVLAEKEHDITKSMQEKNNKNNIVLATLLIFVEKDDKIIPINKDITVQGLLCHKFQIFESTPTLQLYASNPPDSPYSFSNELKDIPSILLHFNKIWGQPLLEDTQPLKKLGKRNDLSAIEEIIWSTFEITAEALWKTADIFKNSIMEAALTNFTAELSNLAHSLTKQPSTSHEHSETLRKTVFKNKDGNKSKKDTGSKGVTKILNDSIEQLRKKKEAIQAYEKEYAKKVIALYNICWHSEQRLLDFLINSDSDSFWEDACEEIEEIIDKIGEVKVTTVFLHLHSRYNLCQTCRNALVRSCHKSGLLKKRIAEKLQKHNTESKFFLKVLASFRVMYAYPFRDEDPIWMSYNVMNTETQVQSLDLKSTPKLFLKKIQFEDKEAQKKDLEYLAESKSQAPNCVLYYNLLSGAHTAF